MLYPLVLAVAPVPKVETRILQVLVFRSVPWEAAAVGRANLVDLPQPHLEQVAEDAEVIMHQV